MLFTALKTDKRRRQVVLQIVHVTTYIINSDQSTVGPKPSSCQPILPIRHILGLLSLLLSYTQQCSRFSCAQ